MTKLGKTYNLLIQIGIFILSYFFIIRQVFWKQNLPELIRIFREDFSSASFLLCLLVLMILMAFNWILETIKWKRMIEKVEKISFWRALEAVLTGVTVSSFTPNRIGEYFGRVFILRKASHIEGILITILGSISQLMITILCGSFALLFFFPLFLPGSVYSSGYLYIVLFSLIIGLDLLLLALFFNVSFLSVLKEKIIRNGLKGLQKYLRVFSFYSNRELLTVLMISLARYIVFSTQYMLLLRILGVNVPFLTAYMIIALIYLVLAVVPTIALTELGVRSSVAIYFFTICLFSSVPAGNVNFSIFIASVLLWIINLGIPAVAGSIFLFRLKFFREQNGS